MKAGLVMSTSVSYDDDRSRFDPGIAAGSSPSGQRSTAVALRESGTRSRRATSKMPACIDMVHVDEEPFLLPPTLQDWCALIAVSVSTPIAYLACAWFAGALQ